MSQLWLMKISAAVNVKYFIKTFKNSDSPDTQITNWKTYFVSNYIQISEEKILFLS